MFNNISFNLWHFVAAVFTNWVAVVTGTIVSLTTLIYEKIIKKSVTRRIVLHGFVVFLLVAFFMAWRDEHRATAEAQKKLEELTTPKLVLEIRQVSFATDPRDGNGVIILNATVTNGGARSIADKWEVGAILPDGKRLRSRLAFIGERISGTTSDGKPIDLSVDAIYDKAIATPIESGARISGLLLADFPGITQDEIEKIRTVILRCRDYRDSLIETKIDLNDERHAFLYIPDMNSRPQKVIAENKNRQQPTIACDSALSVNGARPKLEDVRVLSSCKKGIVITGDNPDLKSVESLTTDTPPKKPK